MEKTLKENIYITDLKEMLNKTKPLYGEKIAYKIRKEEGKYQIFTHKQVRDMIDSLGTALIDMGLKNKRIAIIGENRYEWEIAYLSIVCGTGIVVPLDKSLPNNELEELIQRSEIEAIFYTNKYEETLKNAKLKGIGKLKHLISMNLQENKNGIYSQAELIKEGEKLIKCGDKSFINAKINPEEMQIMLFTSGTTSKSKVVALSHKNLCSNLMDIASVLDINSDDIFLSNLPIHHVFECTVGFLFALYSGAQTVFCDGMRHIIENLNEYHVTVMACVPAIYERIFKIIRKKLEKQGKLEEILEREEKYKNASMEKKREVFKEVHDLIGGRIKLFISGAAKAMKRAIDDAGIKPEDINYINAHGTSTHLNDLTETLAIKNALGEHAKKVMVSSTKGNTGHLLGAAGAVEAIICVKSIETGIVPPTINYKEKDEECDLDIVPNESRKAELNIVMSNSLGFGGHNSSIIFAQKRTSKMGD